MGLDISVYGGLTKSPNQDLDEHGLPVGGVKFGGNMDCFAGREEGIDVDVVYEYGEEFDFRAGSYGGYNRWRETLAKLAGYPPTPHMRYGHTEMLCAAACWAGATGPFSELINFADNEGTIGPVVAKKLAADFAEFDERARAHPDPFFVQKWDDWKRAFEMATNNGVVVFH